MRNLLFIFLISLLIPSSKNEEDYRLPCYTTGRHNACLKQAVKYPQGDEREQKTFECLQNLKEEKRICVSPEVCIKATLTFKDDTQIILLGCEDDATKEKCREFGNEAIVIATGKKLKFPINCTTCTEKLCNPKKKKVETTSVLPEKTNKKPSETRQDKNRSSEILSSLPIIFFLVLLTLRF